MIKQYLYFTVHDDKDSECAYSRVLDLPLVLSVGSYVQTPCWLLSVSSVTIYPDDENQIQICLTDKVVSYPKEDWVRLHKAMLAGGWVIDESFGLAFDAKGELVVDAMGVDVR